VQIVSSDGDVQVSVIYNSKDVYVWRPSEVSFDMEGGFSFCTSGYVWHVRVVVSDTICLQDQFCLSVHRLQSGVICFDTVLNGYNEVVVSGGSRWVNPTSKSILMPCDGRGGGRQPVIELGVEHCYVEPVDYSVVRYLSRSLLKRWKKIKKNRSAGWREKRRFFRLRKRLTTSLPQVCFEPQMFNKLADGLVGIQEKTGSLVSGIQDVAKAMHNAAIRGVSVSDDVFLRLDGLTSELNRFNNNCDSIKEDGLSVNHSFGIDNLFKWCVEHRETVGIVILISVLVVVSIKTGGSALCFALGSLISALAISSSPCIKKVWDEYGPNLTSPVCVFEAQMFDNPLLKSGLLLSYIFGFRGLCVDTLMTRFDKFCSILSEAPRKSGDMLNTVTFYLKSLQDLFNQTLSWIGVDYNINLAPEKYPLSARLLEEITVFLRTSASSKELVVEQAAKVCQVLQARVSDMLVKNKSDHEFAGDRVLLMRALSKLEAYDRELELRGAGRDVTRLPPKAYLFIGQPKIGKSYLLKSLSYMALYTLLEGNEVALEHIRNGQLRDYIFTRNSCDKFWEGYYNQMLVLLDEVGMQRDCAGADAETNEYANFIKMVNDVVFPLLMANVEKKGTREFNSSVIFGTTNCKHFQIESINNKEAYDRRWNTYEVSVKPECGKWYYGHGGSGDWLVPDFDKMKEAGMSEEDIALSRFLEFKPRISLLSSGFSGPSISIDDLIRTMKEDLKTRDSEIETRKRQSDILHNFFDPRKRGLPGSFVPQMDACVCKVCSSDTSRFFSTEQQFCATEILSSLSFPQAQCVFENGYDHVTDENSYLFHANPLCLSEIKKKYPNWNDVQLLFDFGCHVKSLFLINTVFNNKKEKIMKIKNLALKVCGALAAFASLLSLWQIGKLFFADSPKEEETLLQGQSVDLNAQEVLSCVLKRNVYAVGDDKVSQRGFVTFLTDNILAMPRHYLIVWRNLLRDYPDLHVTLRRLGDGSNHQVIRFPAKYIVSDVVVCGKEDLVAVYLGGRVVQRHASIRKYLGCSKRPSGDIYFPKVERDSLKYKLVAAPYQHHGPVSYEVAGEKLGVGNPISYRFKTEIGDCGLPVSRKDPFERCEKICGIHVSGSPKLSLGVATPLTQEMYDEIVLAFAKKHHLVEAQYRYEADVILRMAEDGKCWNDLYETPDQFKVEGKVNLGYVEAASVPGNTSIVPSPLFEEIGFPHQTKPARLRPFIGSDGNLVDPNALATLKYHRTVASFDLDVLDACKNSVTDLVVNNPMLQHHPDVKREPLSFEDAVQGIPGIEGLDGIPRKTSAGYPRCLTVDKRGKRDFFGDSGDYVFDSSGANEIRRSVENMIISAKKGIRGNHVFMDFPKDERRPKAKVDAGKTRKISACPVDLAIGIRMMFGAFVQDFMYNRIVNQCALGVNVFDSQWDQMAIYLGEDTRVIAGDFGNYDGSLPYCLMIRFLDTVTEYYGDRGSENERAREVLFQELANSRHIMNGALYEWVGSNASGNPLTTVLNSWCNLVLLRYATLKCVGKCNMRDGPKFLKSLDSHARFMVYGDDNLISVRRDSKFLDMLTQVSYTEAFASMGFEYTDETKGAAILGEDRSITEVGFLKRRWAQTSLSFTRKFLSPLALETILESIQWTKRADFDCSYVRENVVNMLQELSQHERSVFDEWAPKIVEACRRTMNYVPLPNTYEECQAVILSRESF